MLGEFLRGFGIFVGYYLIAVTVLMVFKFLFKPPRELFRKLLHLVCAMSAVVLLYIFDIWYLAMFTVIAFALALYPLLTFLERFPKIMDLIVPRNKGEIRSSLVIVFLMMAVLIAVFWGWLGYQWRYIIVVSIMAWGFGDAAAALVGKAFGKNRIVHKFVEGTKTREGTIAMYAVSGVAILITLLVYTTFPWYLCLLGALLVAPICAIVELVSRRGLDTITVPFATAIPLFLIMILFNFIGV